MLLLAEGMGWNYFGPVSALTWIIPLPFLYRSVKNYREHNGEGFITFKKAFVEGMKTTFFSS